jgi:hypothetical protein
MNAPMTKGCPFRAPGCCLFRAACSRAHSRPRSGCRSRNRFRDPASRSRSDWALEGACLKERLPLFCDRSREIQRAVQRYCASASTVGTSELTGFLDYACSLQKLDRKFSISLNFLRLGEGRFGQHRRSGRDATLFGKRDGHAGAPFPTIVGAHHKASDYLQHRILGRALRGLAGRARISVTASTTCMFRFFEFLHSDGCALAASASLHPRETLWPQIPTRQRPGYCKCIEIPEC